MSARAESGTDPVDRSLHTSRGELGALLALTALFAATQDLLGPEWIDTVNFFGPLALTAILGMAALRMLRLNPASLWSALFWFRIATALYFGFGQMAPFLMNGWSRIYFGHYFDPSPADFLKLNTIVSLGAACTLIGSGLLASLLRPALLQTADLRAIAQKTDSMRRLGLMLLIAGGLIKYLLLFPQAMGWTEGVIPGAIVILGSTTLAGTYLLTLWALSTRHRVAFLVISLFVVLEMASGLVLMVKSEVLLPALVYLMAILSHRATLARLGFAAVALIALFAVLVPLVSHGRDRLGQIGLKRGDIGIAERLDLLASYYDPSSAFAPPDEYQGGYLRISYASMGGFFVNRYDMGLPGNSLEYLAVVFVPRILWPEKPIINLGQQMSVLVSGNENNAIGAGLFFESYWNLGWAGLPLIMFPFGCLLQLLSRFANYVIQHGLFIHMPALFIAMRVGLSIDNHIVGLAGGIGQLVVMSLVVMLVSRAFGITQPAAPGQDGSTLLKPPLTRRAR